MKRALLVSLLSVAILAGCYSDVTVTKELKTLNRKCVYVGEIKSENPYAAEILKNCLQKEFVKARFEICPQDSATMIVTGNVFMAPKEKFSAGGGVGSYGGAAYAKGEKSIIIDSVSVAVKTKNGTLLAIASFNNWADLNVERVGYFLGYDLANKLK